MNGEPNTEGNSSFPSTYWTLIFKAIQSGDNAAAEAALGRFCERYRPAIVNFFVRRGCPKHQAEDYAQEFFLTRIHNPWDVRSGLLFNVERREGKLFRSLLAVALHRFLIDQWRKKAAPSDPATSAGDPADTNSGFDAGTGNESEKIQEGIDRELAVQTIRDAIQRAQPSPSHVKFWNQEITQKDAAAALNQSEDAFTQSYARFRRRLREELRKAVAEMIDESEDVDSEIKYFLSIFARSRTSL